MGKAVGGLPQTSALNSSEAARNRGIGAWLARQRRLRGISLDELESLTRVPRRSLERLEAGAYDAAPDGFARGFVRTVASAIGLDPDDAVSRMLSEVVVPPPRRRPIALPLLLGMGVLLGTSALLALATGLVSLPRGWGLPVMAPSPSEVRRRDFVSELAADVAAGRVAVPPKPAPERVPEPVPAAEPAPAPVPEAAHVAEPQEE